MDRVEVIAEIGRAIAIGRGGEAEEDGVRAVDDGLQIVDEEQIAVEVFGDDAGEAGLVDVAFDLLALGGAVGGEAGLVDIVGIDFMAIFGADGSMGQADESGSGDDNLHSYPFAIDK